TTGWTDRNGADRQPSVTQRQTPAVRRASAGRAQRTARERWANIVGAWCALLARAGRTTVGGVPLARCDSPVMSGEGGSREARAGSNEASSASNASMLGKRLAASFAMAF